MKDLVEGLLQYIYIFLFHPSNLRWSLFREYVGVALTTREA